MAHRKDDRKVLTYNRKAFARDVCGVEETNYPNRKDMEDGLLIDLNFIQYHNLYAIFDGHGGANVKNHLVKNFSGVLAAKIQERFDSYKEAREEENYKEALKEAFFKINAEMKDFGQEEGSTGCVCLEVEMQDGNSQKRVRRCFIANVGDTRCVHWKKGMACERLSKDHKPTDPGEIERVEKKKGMIIDNRLGGVLAVTRAFGDLSLETEGLSCEPDIRTIDLDEDSQYLIMASDGLWDVLKDEDVPMVCLRHMGSTKSMAISLVDLAMVRGTRDNTTVLVLACN